MPRAKKRYTVLFKVVVDYLAKDEKEAQEKAQDLAIKIYAIDKLARINEVPKIKEWKK